MTQQKSHFAEGHIATQTKSQLAVSGAYVKVSYLKEKIEELKRGNEAVEELRLVGLSALHIDCDLDQDTWHGTNVSVSEETIGSVVQLLKKQNIQHLAKLHFC